MELQCWPAPLKYGHFNLSAILYKSTTELLKPGELDRSNGVRSKKGYTELLINCFLHGEVTEVTISCKVMQTMPTPVKMYTSTIYTD